MAAGKCTLYTQLKKLENLMLKGYLISKAHNYKIPTAMPALCHDVSVRLSVTEVHWRIIANLGFKFTARARMHCDSPCMPGRGEGSSRTMLATARLLILFCQVIRKHWLIKVAKYLQLPIDLLSVYFCPKSVNKCKI